MLRDGKSSQHTQEFIDVINEFADICKERERLHFPAGTKENPLIFCVSRKMYDWLVEKGLYKLYQHDGDELICMYGEWWRIYIQEPLPEGSYYFTECCKDIVNPASLGLNSAENKGVIRHLKPIQKIEKFEMKALEKVVKKASKYDKKRKKVKKKKKS